MSGRTPLSVPAFRRAWIGFTISAAGDAASWIALVVLCLGPADGRLPVLAVLYTAPVAIGGIAAGWVLDRFDRRLVIIVDSVVRGVAFASIPAVMAVGSVSATHLYAVTAVYGLLKMVSLAGFPTLIPSLVTDDRLDQANALEGMSFGLASVSGAALAGLGVASVGAGPVIAFDALSYLVLAGSLLSVRQASTSARPAPATSRRRWRSGFGDTLRLAVTDPVLRTTTIMFALFNVGDGCLLVFLPHRAIDLGLGPSGYGYLVAATTGGGLAAGVVLAGWRWPWPLPTSIVAAQLAAAAAVALLVAASTARTLAGLALLGLLSAPLTAWAQTLRMRAAPPELHGRLFAVLRTTMQATPPLGAALGALLLAHGPTATVLGVVAVMALPALLLGPGLLRDAKPSLVHDSELLTKGSPADVANPGER